MSGKWIPTATLRIVIKDSWDETGSDSFYRPTKTLQQLWVSVNHDRHHDGQEWRDVEEVHEDRL